MGGKYKNGCYGKGMLECGIVSSGSRWNPLMGCYGYGDKLLDSMKSGSFLIS